MEEKRLYRYPGVQPFREDQQNLFFGRDEDRERLLDLVLLEKLTVLFGKSGYGKSSLLNAGITPGLEQENRRGKKDYVALPIRFYPWNEKEQNNWWQWFSFHVQEKTQGPDIEALAKRTFLPATIWGILKQYSTSTNQVFILVFDQFEEFFTYPETQRQEFRRQLAEVLYADTPVYLKHNEHLHNVEEIAFISERIEAKAVFSIRADRLSDLDEFKDKLPAILHKRYELKALNGYQAGEAIIKPAALENEAFLSRSFRYNQNALKKILRELSAPSSGRAGGGGIEAFQLQILCQYIENYVVKSDKQEIDENDLPDIANIYEEYYKRQVELLDPVLQETARHIIEDGLLFEDLVKGDARRLSMDADVLARQFGTDKKLLEALENTFLLRREANALGSFNYEISHDTLIAPILKAKATRRVDEERRENERKRLEAESKALEEKQKRLEAERQRRLARLLAAAAVVGFVIALALGFWAIQQKKIADEQRQTAVEALIKLQVEEQRRVVAEAQKEKSDFEKMLPGVETILSAGGCPPPESLEFIEKVSKGYLDDTILQEKIRELIGRLRERNCIQ